MKTFKGKPIKVVGEELKVGVKAPNFKVVDSNFEDVSLDDFKEPYLVINVVPSLDTTVCNLQTKTINQELSERQDTLVLTISNDLPFAQKRWCGIENLNVVTLSDYLYNDFGKKYGLLMEDLKLLARGIFVLNKNREIIYVEYAEEMAQHLNYDLFLEFINKMPEE